MPDNPKQSGCTNHWRSTDHLESFLLYCLFEDSPKIDAAELVDIGYNHSETARRGRDPEFRLRRDGQEVTLREWASEILDKVHAVSQVIDRHDDNYSAAVDSLRRLVEDPEATLSSRIVRELEATGSSFFEFARGMAKCHRDYFSSIAPLDPAKADTFAMEATDSLQRQEAIEAADTVSLDDYLAHYFRPC